MDETQQVPNQNPITSISPLTMTQPTPSNNNPWALISLIIILIGIASYFGYQNYQLKQQLAGQKPASSPDASVITSSPISTSNPTVDETVNWHEYKSNDFSFKYPSDWKIVTDCKFGQLCVASADFQQTVNEVGDGGGFYIAKTGGIFSVNKSTITQPMNIEDFCHPGGPLIISSCTDTLLTSIKAKKRVNAINVNGSEYSTDFGLLIDKTLFILSQGYSNGNRSTLSTLDTILSTFQFTN